MKKTVYGSWEPVLASIRKFILIASPLPAPIMRTLKLFKPRFQRPIMKKMLMTMKLLTIFLFVGLTATYAEGTAQNITLSGKKLSLKEVFIAIEKQTGYVVFANEDYLLQQKTLDLEVKNIKLTTLLDMVLRDQPVNYSFEGETIILSPKVTKGHIVSKIPLPATAPPIRIRVTDQDGKPLAGATVTLKKSGKTTITDANGDITVNMEANEIAIITYVGYVQQEVTISGNKHTILVVLQLSEDTNEEVVIMGYGQVKKGTEMVGSAIQLNEDRIKNMPAARIDAILEGQIPGLRVTLNSDDASSTKQRINIRVRGQGSFNASNEPLWIVDGTPIYSGDRTNLIPGIQTSISPLSYINTADIKSITLLKDASAAAIYGANASNGVIIVTTKSGSIQKPTLSLGINTGFNSIKKSTKFRTLDGAQYMELAKESYANAGRDLITFPYSDNDMNSYSTTNTNWTDEFYGTGVVNDINLALRGGTEKLKYSVAGGFYNNRSTIKGNTQGRNSLSANLQYRVNSKLDVAVITRYSNNKNNTFNPGMDYLDYLPIFSLYNNDGSFRLYNKKVSGLLPNGDPIYTTVKFFNSIAEREENDDIQKTNLLNNNFKIGYEILSGLKSTTQYGVDFMEINQNIYKARTNWSGFNSKGESVGYGTKAYNKTITKTFIERLNYSKSWGIHQLSALAGLELLSQQYRTHNVSGTKFKDDLGRTVNDADSLYGIYSSKRTKKQASYFAQADYSYDNKYFAQITGRRDGSSTFGSDARWGNFSAFGIGWNIKNDLIAQSKVIDYLRLDATYGNTGNSRLSNQETFGSYSTRVTDEYDSKPGSVLTTIPNRKLRWESARQTNLKLNIGLFDRLTFLVEAYRKKTVQAIVDLSVSRTTGATSAQSNTGELENTGIELTAKWDVIKNEQKELHWWIEVNAAHNRNKALKLYNENERTFGNFIWREGYDINTFYLIRWAGVDPRDGAPLWYDANDNLTRIYNIDNRVPGKSANPDLFGGIRTEFSYKAFSLSALFNYNIGGYQFSTFSRGINSDGLNIEADNQSANQIYRWQQPGDVAINPKPIWGISSRSTMNSTRFLYKTTFVRLNNVVLGYQIPQNAAKKLGLASCNVNLIANELVFWTPYDKVNRKSYKQSFNEQEVISQGMKYEYTNMNSFKQSRSYPMESSFILAINVTF